ncbi:hypothetical protein ACFTAO_33845 [Paenibacillus rhizoplanae]
MMLFIWGFIVVLIIGIIFLEQKGIKQGNVIQADKDLKYIWRNSEPLKLKVSKN